MFTRSCSSTLGRTVCATWTPSTPLASATAAAAAARASSSGCAPPLLAASLLHLAQPRNQARSLHQAPLCSALIGPPAGAGRPLQQLTPPSVSSVSATTGQIEDHNDGDDDDEGEQEEEKGGEAEGSGDIWDEGQGIAGEAGWGQGGLLTSHASPFPSGSGNGGGDGGSPELAPGLYIVGTPIGNLEDISYRAVRVLRTADLVLAEDTRRSGALCRRFGVGTRLASYHEHNERRRTVEALALLKGGAAVALISDAGMPGISDPGSRVVAAAIDAGIPVIPIPGPCALLAALVASGLPTEEFHFAGFLPPKRGARAARLAALAGLPGTLVLYVSPHSLAAVLRDAAEQLGTGRRVVLARELTKLHEEFQRMTLGEAVQVYQERKPKGEFVMLVEGGEAAAADAGPPDEAQWRPELQRLLQEGMPASSAARHVATTLGVPRKQVYAAAMQLSGDQT